MRSSTSEQDIQLIKKYLQEPNTQSSCEKLFQQISLQRLGELLFVENQQQREENTLLLSNAWKQLLDYPVTLQQLNSKEGIYLIRQGISSGQCETQKVCCLAVEKLVLWNPTCIESFQEQQIIDSMLALIREEDLELVKQLKSAILCVVKVASELTCEYIASKLEGYAEGGSGMNTTVRTRALQWLIDWLVQVSNASLAAKVCSILVEQLQSSVDVLFQLNILELLATFVSVENATWYVTNSGILSTLYSLLSDDSTDMDNVQLRLLQSAILKWIARVASLEHVDPLALVEPFVPLLGRLIENREDLDKQESAFYALSAIASTRKGMEVVWNEELLTLVLSALDTPEERIRTACLYCIASLLNSSDETSSKQLFEMYRKGPLLETLFVLARQPFLSQSIAVFIVLEAIAEKDWGLRKLSCTAGIVDIIVNDVVDNKPLLDAKQKLARALIRQESVSSILFGDARYRKLLDFASRFALGGVQSMRMNRDPQVDIATMRQ
ncbi:hypothetical protein GpartN1_g3262.t1 [Galdieria partita]|uniref:Uncharacterized protein n=1 Tax=Galdieria partita TaxID=83374 RepID=A0A9C7UQB3_9RHOD|nr:hypothetical protein GpartN1_g3262.t1 [Galdieria partita]